MSICGREWPHNRPYTDARAIDGGFREPRIGNGLSHDPPPPSVALLRQRLNELKSWPPRVALSGPREMNNAESAPLDLEGNVVAVVASCDGSGLTSVKRMALDEFAAQFSL